MHEWALADGVISSILENVDLSKYKIVSVEVVVGELQQIELDAFKFALETISKETPIKNAEFKITIEKAVLQCNVCGNEWFFEDALKNLGEEEAEAVHFVPEAAHAFISCPKCGSSDFNIKKGRGLYVKNLIAEVKE